MSSKPEFTLTQANPEYTFNAQPGALKRINTSGVIGASPATIKVQERTTPTDDWRDNPNYTFDEGVHLSLVMDVSAVYNRIVVEDPDGTTEINGNL